MRRPRQPLSRGRPQPGFAHLRCCFGKFFIHGDFADVGAVDDVTFGGFGGAERGKFMRPVQPGARVDGPVRAAVHHNLLAARPSGAVAAGRECR